MEEKYQPTTAYEYADAAKTVIKQTSINYIDLAAIEAKIAEIDKQLADLPQPKLPPGRDDFDKNYKMPGWTYDQFCELAWLRNDHVSVETHRESLRSEKTALLNDIAMLKAKVG